MPLGMIETPMVQPLRGLCIDMPTTHKVLVPMEHKVSVRMGHVVEVPKGHVMEVRRGTW